MKITLTVEIDTCDDGSVIINEQRQVNRLYIQTEHIANYIMTQFPAKTRVSIEAYRGTERLHGACLREVSR